MKLELIRFGGLWDEDICAHTAGSVYSMNGLCPTLDTGGGTHVPYFIVDNSNLLWYNKEKLKVGECDG